MRPKSFSPNGLFRRIVVLLIGATAALFLGSGCKSTSTPTAVTWPDIDALPTAPPEGLDRDAPGSILRKGPQGLLYVVGGVPSDAGPGTTFLARYSQEWPLEDLPRPPLATGEVVRRFDDDVALVNLSYGFPEAELEGLEVTWEAGDHEEDLGKGVATVTSIKPSEKADLELSAGSDLGVQAGDIYAILRPVGADPDTAELQLSRRIQAICLVNDTAANTSTCRLWHGSSMLPFMKTPKVGHRAVFLEHTFGKSPNEAVIQIAAIHGDDDTHALREMLAKSLRTYVSTVPAANAKVESIDEKLDATRVEFYRYERDINYQGVAQILVGASVKRVDGQKHLFVNYTGIGPANGPGMVAAPPEGGIDLGPIETLNLERLQGFMQTVWSAVLVFRGQTSEAMMHLRLLLSDPGVEGALRWHARDQFAMRWAALDRPLESMWLVMEDEAVAKRKNDRDAWLNALGTRVRLHEMLGAPNVAFAAAKEYLQARREEKPNGAFLSALGMYAEMAFAAGSFDKGKHAVEELRTSCEDGCEGDLAALLSGIYWAVPEERIDYQEKLLEYLLELNRENPGPRLAATRLYQGLAAMQNDQMEDALIAFLEAERLYREANYGQGAARALYFKFLAQLSRGQKQKAFEAAVESAEMYRQMHDFRAVARTYERLITLYASFGEESGPGPYLGAAKDVMLAAVQAQLALGDYSRASEGLFSLGTFMMKIGQLDRSQNYFQRAVLYAIRSTRFDMAALSHLSLGVIARHQNNEETFRDEIQRAKLMAEISNDPQIMKTIKRALQPPEDEPDVPTQLL